MKSKYDLLLVFLDKMYSLTINVNIERLSSGYFVKHLLHVLFIMFAVRFFSNCKCPQELFRPIC
jgi:hypothetical protein